jgi:hypothetical protein
MDDFYKPQCVTFCDSIFEADCLLHCGSESISVNLSSVERSKMNRSLLYSVSEEKHQNSMLDEQLHIHQSVSHGTVISMAAQTTGKYEHMQITFIT